MVKIALGRRALLEEGIDPDYLSDVLSSASPKVRALEWSSERDALTVEFDGPRDAAEALVGRIKAKIGRGGAGRSPRVVYSNSPGVAPEKRDVWQSLVERRLVKDYGGGHVSYGGLFLELVRGLDALVYGAGLARGAEPVHLPGLLRLEYMKRLGTFDQSPHHLYFTAPLVGDVEWVEDFQREAAADAAAARKYLAAPEYCLKTSACSPLYLMLEDARLEDYAHYTVLGNCSRHEALNTARLERLTEFQMREIVFVGDEQGVREFQDFGLSLFRDVIECFDLPARVSTASDPFFVANYSQYRLMQLLGDDKFEAKVSIPDSGAEIAFGSFNNHRNFFSRRLGFRYRGEPAASACVGFGLERMAYGILCRHGLDESRLFPPLESLKARYAAAA